MEMNSKAGGIGVFVGGGGALLYWNPHRSACQVLSFNEKPFEKKTETKEREKLQL